jgi:hypothetical protein
MRRNLLALLVAVLLAACTSGADDAAPTTSTTASTTAPTTLAPGIGVRPIGAFGDLRDVPLLDDEPAYAGPSTPSSLDGVLWADQVPDTARETLAANGFVVVRSAIGQFHEAYSDVELTSRQPLFVTADAAYHYWHLAFAKALRDTEQLALLPVLEDFARRLTEVTAPDGGAVAHFAEVLGSLLGVRDGSASEEVEAELALIDDHVGVATSPATGASVDYSLFRPRGHYTRSPELTRYFLAMSLLGQAGFLIAEPDQLRTGLELAGLITGDEALERDWRALYEPTAFLVGLADDFTPEELADAADAVDPEWRGSPDVLDDAFLGRVAAELERVREVAIDPERASMRVMGTRLVLDSYILDQLVHPNVPGRLEASVLDVAAAFGSDWAHDRQVDVGVTDDHPDYEGQLSKMADLVAGRPIEAWASTVYDAWLYALQPMWSAHGAAYPDLMRTDAWAAKSHTTGFGSYAELKHDTVLYAKQAFAEGEAPPAPAEPRHWVEPEPVVFGRLAAVADLLRQGLGARELLSDEVDALLQRLTDLYGRFERLARDELAGTPIAAEDNEWLETISSRLELLWLLTSEDAGEGEATTGGYAASPDDVAALVTDIMSNPTDALEIGTGYIDQLYVLVPNDEGAFQVARGGVYSFYELWVPRDERLTDEEWRDRLAAGDAPDRPAWSEEIIVDP